MDSYDPEASRSSADWLQTDEGERIELVSSYHRRKKIHLPNAQLSFTSWWRPCGTNDTGAPMAHIDLFGV
jgi:hypothetical protein